MTAVQEKPKVILYEFRYKLIISTFPSHCFQGYNTPFSGMRKKPHLWVLTWVDFVCRFEEKKLVREGLPSQSSDHVK